MSLCSSNNTKDVSPLKKTKIKKITELEDVDLIVSISSLIEDTIKRNATKKKNVKKIGFLLRRRKNSRYFNI